MAREAMVIRGGTDSGGGRLRSCGYMEQHGDAASSFNIDSGEIASEKGNGNDYNKYLGSAVGPDSPTPH